jgi:hypothetical protein
MVGVLSLVVKHTSMHALYRGEIKREKGTPGVDFFAVKSVT